MRKRMHLVLLWASLSAAIGPAASGGEFAFQLHEIGKPGGESFGQTSLVDVDGDGDLDFISGSRGARAAVWWWEYQAADRWVQHRIGDNPQTDVAGAAFDVDADGDPDQVSGGTLFLHPGKDKVLAEPFGRHEINTIPSHDMRVGDINRDGRADLVAMSDAKGVFWYDLPAAPTDPWIERRIGDARHSGLALGDLDGDGDLDVVRADWWFENLDGRGATWHTHRNIPFPGKNYNQWGMSTQGVLADLDGDGDLDIGMTDGETDAAAAAWIENVDGKGRRFERHSLAVNKGALHSMIAADFDQDGDRDVFSCEFHIGGGGRWFIWENPGHPQARDERRWTEHVILENVEGHETRAGDVDGDGDLDLCSKPWNGDRHVYLRNLLIENGRK